MSIMHDEPAGTGEALWHRAAGRVAEELRLDPGQGRTAKVSSLLHVFRSQGVHCDIENMMEALLAQGVTAHSHGREISRRDVLDLHLSSDDAAEMGAQTVDPGIRVSRWHVGEVGRPKRIDEAGDLSDPTSEGVLWFDVDPRHGEPSVEAVNEVTELLQPWCPDLTRVIVRDLLTPDIQPKSETYGDDRTGVRTVSVPALVSREVPDDHDDFDGVDEQLVVQLVELVVGPGWMITCWHRSRTLLGGGRVDEGPPLLREPFLDHVGHRWVHDAGSQRAKGAGELAAYLARSLVATYGASLRMLQRWVSSWEVAFYKTLGDQDRAGSGERKSLKDAAVEISNFLGIVGEFSRSVNAFRLAGDELPNETWFADPAHEPGADPTESAPSEQTKALESSVEAAAEKLAQLYDEIRADMDLLFVAGLFGANTALPGQGSWGGFDLMLVLMALSAAISYWVIRRLME